MKGIADTGFLVAFGNRRDTHHDWALEIAQRVTGPLLTCEAVLADLCLIRMSELHPKHPVITTDVSDFKVYRRGRREMIPLIHPPTP